MNFAFSDKQLTFQHRLEAFMDEHVYPNEALYEEQLDGGGSRWQLPAIMDALKARAREAGLWNLFLPDSDLGAGLSNLDYAPLAEIMGRSPIGPEVFNCSAPDTGNMEVLARFASREHQERWLNPLLDGEIRSGFAMTEPAVASSDAGNIQGSMALAVIDRAIQVHGAAGVCDDFGLAKAWARARSLRLADGPDEVHRRTVAREELKKEPGRGWRQTREPSA